MNPRRAAPVLLAAGLALVAAGCTSGAEVRADVVQQHTSAQAPDDVVRAYLDAVQRGDDESAAVLSTPTYAAGDGWQQGDDPGLEDVDVSSRVVPYDTTWSSEELQAYEQVVSVPVTFTVTDAGQGFSVGGPSGWGYVLVRHRDEEPWLIAEAGNG